jgi:hypothetical protein
MQLETEIAAWALDEACLMIGRKFENMLNDGKNPFSEQLTVNSDQKFASAPKRFVKKVKDVNSIR